MSILPLRRLDNGYPTSDGKPMAETDYHRDLMMDLIATLRAYYAEQENVYVSGNLLLFYQENNRRKHISPDVFVVQGVGKYQRPNYLLWEERSPAFVIELTSSSTRKEDVTTKMALYQDVLKVQEYFLFDPCEDYLDPSMQGWRLRSGTYRRIRPVAGRLPSRTTGLHLERDGTELRLWNPTTGERLLLPVDAANLLAEEAEDRAEEMAAHAQQQIATVTRARQEAERQAADSAAEVARLRRELAILRGEVPPPE
jgi:Uma2 family endonuclease